MASSGFTIAIAVMIILIDASKATSASKSISISPPSFVDVCQNVSCGNGFCRPAKNSSVPFECVCDANWKQPDSGIGFHFLPCILPNYVLSKDCAKLRAIL